MTSCHVAAKCFINSYLHHLKPSDTQTLTWSGVRGQGLGGAYWAVAFLGGGGIWGISPPCSPITHRSKLGICYYMNLFIDF